MNLQDLVLFLLTLLIGYQFWHIRSIAESAKQHINDYCDQHDLQLLSVARHKTRIADHRGKLKWKTVFEFEFSGDGESKYTGHITMFGLDVHNFDLPAYKVD